MGKNRRGPNFCQIVCFVSTQRPFFCHLYLNPIQVDTFHMSFITLCTRLINDIAEFGPFYIRHTHTFSSIQLLRTSVLLSCSSFFPIVNDSLLVCLCLVKFSLTSKHFISFSRAIQYFCLIFFDIVTTHKKEEGGERIHANGRTREEQKYCQCYFSIKFGALWDLEQ